MPYLLDANVFIQAKNLHYGLDFCPAFWDWLIAGNDARHIKVANISGIWRPKRLKRLINRRTILNLRGYREK